MRPCQQLVRDHAPRIDIRPLVDLVARRLLWRHVTGRAKRRPASGESEIWDSLRRVQRLRDPEVRDDRSPARKEHVLGLDVAVDDAVGVGEFERAGDVAEYPHRFMQRRRTFFHSLAEIQPFDEGHTIEWERARCSSAEYRDDVGLLQPRHKLDLAGEALDVERHGQLGHQDLDDYIPAQRLVARQKDERHSSAAQLTGDCVVGTECVSELVLEVGRAIPPAGGEYLI